MTEWDTTEKTFFVSLIRDVGSRCPELLTRKHNLDQAVGRNRAVRGDKSENVR